MSSKLNLAITYICTGKYNQFFKDFYESFKDNFCKNHNITFVIITDNPVNYVKYNDCKVYHVQRYFRHNDLNFIKFRKWRDILLAEDYLETQDYCFYMNGNLRCNRPVYIEELFGEYDQYAVTHSLFNSDSKAMYESLTKCEQSAAYFKAWDKTLYPNYKYFQAGNVGAISSKFLKMAKFIESARYFDDYNNLDKNIEWHDETYYNKYINSVLNRNPQTINIIDGKNYLCTHLDELKSYRPSCKMFLIDKVSEWNKGV